MSAHAHGHDAVGDCSEAGLQLHRRLCHAGILAYGNHHGGHTVAAEMKCFNNQLTADDEIATGAYDSPAGGNSSGCRDGIVSRCSVMTTHDQRAIRMKCGELADELGLLIVRGVLLFLLA